MQCLLWVTEIDLVADQVVLSAEPLLSWYGFGGGRPTFEGSVTLTTPNGKQSTSCLHLSFCHFEERGPRWICEGELLANPPFLICDNEDMRIKFRGRVGLQNVTRSLQRQLNNKSFQVFGCRIGRHFGLLSREPNEPQELNGYVFDTEPVDLKALLITDLNFPDETLAVVDAIGN